jgi:HAD superfamily hydrolase (TIGR01509 family)
MIKAALFDLDGTLFDTEPAYSIFWGSMGRKYRPDIENFENLIKGTTLTQILGTYFPQPELQQSITSQLNEFEHNMDYSFIAGAESFLKQLRECGIKTAVVTSANIKKMENVNAKVPALSLLFDHILTAEDFAKSKPHPDCYLRAAAKCEAKINECVVFEDAFTGLQAGMSAEMLTIGLATTNARDAISGKCHHVVDDFTQLSIPQVEAWLAARNPS